MFVEVEKRKIFPELVGVRSKASYQGTCGRIKAVKAAMGKQQIIRFKETRCSFRGELAFRERLQDRSST